MNDHERRRDRIHLQHILEAIRRIEEYTSAGKAEFMQSHLLQDATLRNLQTMAKFTQRIPDSLKATQPTVQWKALSGFRNVLTHGYLGIDLSRVWQIIGDQVPALKAAIQEMAAKEAGPDA